MPTPQARRINQLWDGHPARAENGAKVKFKRCPPSPEVAPSIMVSRDASTFGLI
jgi:hypothetical protein